MGAKKTTINLKKEELTAYVKYNTFDKEQDKIKKKHKTFSKENLYYN